MPEPKSGRIDAIAVVGTSQRVRRASAHRLAREHGFIYVPPEQTARGVAAVDRVVDFVTSMGGAPGIVLEYATDTPIVEIVGALGAEAAGTRLRGVICVIDAPQFLTDLSAGAGGRTGAPEPSEAKAGWSDREESTSADVLVAHVEFSSVVEVWNREDLGEGEVQRVFGLLSHLAPEATVAPARNEEAPVPAPVDEPGAPPMCAGRPTPGWVAVLNREFIPCHHAPGLTVVRYEQVRPFHPARLRAVITRCLARGGCGHIVRSAGFAHVATCPHVTGQWDQVAASFSLTPIVVDAELESDEGILAIGQDIVFFGFGLDALRLRTALDFAVLDDGEFTAGPVVWSTFDDALPHSWS